MNAPPLCLIYRFGGGRNVGRRQLADQCDPSGLTSLPCSLIFAAHISSVDQLVAVGRRAADGDRQGGLSHRLEAHGNLAEVQIDVRDILSGLGGDSVQAKRVVAAGNQVGCQHLIDPGVVGLIENAVVEPGAVSASGEDGRPGRIGGNPVMPVKFAERHVAGVGDGEVIPHLAPGQRLGVASLGDGHAQVGGLVVVACRTCRPPGQRSR